MSTRSVFLSHRSSLEHDTGPHPENIARIKSVVAELERHDFFGYENLSSPAVERSVLELVHPAAHIDMVARVAQGGGGHIDADTVLSSGSYVAALHAAGGAVELVRQLVRSEAAVGFSAHRPPGHHATATRAMGFCLFNSVAVAARYATDELGLDRVLILDWDVHHGNGTNDIFWEDPRVLFCSIHQSPLYPGSGSGSEAGGGMGRGYTVNVPVPPGSGDEVFVSLVRDVAVPLAEAFKPQLILVSTGYDAHRDDPLAGCMVSDAGFAGMTALIRDAAGELDVGLGFALEGGYDLAALTRCVAVTMQVAAPIDDETHNAALHVAMTHNAAVDVDTHPLAVQARERLSDFWPSLS